MQAVLQFKHLSTSKMLLLCIFGVLKNPFGIFDMIKTFNRTKLKKDELFCRF